VKKTGKDTYIKKKVDGKNDADISRQKLPKKSFIGIPNPKTAQF